MKYIIFLYLFFLINCQKKKNDVNIGDITKIIYISDNITYDITGNFYILDKRFKNPGQHNLNLNNHDLDLIKSKIIDNDIYKLNDSLEFIKTCKTEGCLSKINIKYASGRNQYFIFDNLNYRNNFNNKSYKKIISIEEIIGKIIVNNIKEPEPVNIHL
ncbi:hypothetical protein [Chryseobacterium sp. PMSZPI]|uniref:hypothetical protein n=1 Tax=Chryseobacterium sp. PMSZPI TaxID=1033900 RepID=UPI000C32806C|nr:hypothetical protein [Chryseobacterium sp. PMSZPI]PKF75336.1 hypothetical protein CW752_05125 [Chryseobacterium sp. PMSZPI]